MKKIRVGVIGIGHLGTFHSKIYSQIPDVEVSFLSDIDLEKARSLASELKAEYSDDFRDGLSKVDAVSIATPTSTHYSIAKEFLSNGVDVLVEKPITIKLKDAESLIAIAKKNSRILQVGHVERFNKALTAIEDIPGEIKFIECHRIGSFSKRSTDVSVVLDLMIHDLDIILQFVSSRIKKIEATGLKVITDHPDIANARITFKNKTVCNITSSRVSDDSLRKIRIFKENCYISLDYQNQEVNIYRKVNGEIKKKHIDIEKEQPLQLELRSFVDAVKNRTQPEVSGEDARLALETALKIERIISRN
ncbi:MAG: Gfo/Idh/MocA family oxidoreductase [Candidatus Kaelpia aquatica]|nr:Gfo/Idh/MocA family oxidoreductase [Candidatus Kaelpia aquatica]